MDNAKDIICPFISKVADLEPKIFSCREQMQQKALIMQQSTTIKLEQAVIQNQRNIKNLQGKQNHMNVQ